MGSHQKQSYTYSPSDKSGEVGMTEASRLQKNAEIPRAWIERWGWTEEVVWAPPEIIKMFFSIDLMSTCGLEYGATIHHLTGKKSIWETSYIWVILLQFVGIVFHCGWCNLAIDWWIFLSSGLDLILRQINCRHHMQAGT